MTQKTDKPLDTTKTKADVKAASAPNTTAQTTVDTLPSAEKLETPQQAGMPEALVKPEIDAPENAVAPDNADATSNAEASETNKEAQKPIDTPTPVDAAVNKTTAKTTSAKTANAGGLPADLLELVNELRDTVKGINPKKHTLKTLKRTLANIGDILADIEKIYHKN